MRNLDAVQDNTSVILTTLTFRQGVDHDSRPILVLSACQLPDPNVINYDLILRFVKCDRIIVEKLCLIAYFLTIGLACLVVP
jgi:hypothetical protein